MTGIDYPTVTIGGRTLTVKFSLAAQMLMRRRGLDIRKVPSLLAAKLHADGSPCLKPGCDQQHTRNPQAEDNILSVFACMVAHEFVDLNHPGTVTLDAAPSADYWAVMTEDFTAIEMAVWGSLGKALEARRTQLQVVPPPAAESLAS